MIDMTSIGIPINISICVLLQLNISQIFIYGNFFFLFLSEKRESWIVIKRSVDDIKMFIWKLNDPFSLIVPLDHRKDPEELNSWEYRVCPNQATIYIYIYIYIWEAWKYLTYIANAASITSNGDNC